MADFLLDTNILSDVIKNPRGGTAGRIRQIGRAELCTSIVVVAELRFGVAKSRSRRLAQRLAELLQTLAVLPLEPPVDRVYGDMRAELERRGLTIGANDMLIAAHAIALGCTLVTDNEREFRRVDGLNIENWLDRSERNR